MFYLRGEYKSLKICNFCFKYFTEILYRNATDFSVFGISNWLKIKSGKIMEYNSLVCV